MAIQSPLKVTGSKTIKETEANPPRISLRINSLKLLTRLLLRLQVPKKHLELFISRIVEAEVAIEEDLNYADFPYTYIMVHGSPIWLNDPFYRSRAMEIGFLDSLSTNDYNDFVGFMTSLGRDGINGGASGMNHAAMEGFRDNFLKEALHVDAERDVDRLDTILDEKRAMDNKAGLTVSNEETAEVWDLGERKARLQQLWMRYSMLVEKMNCSR